MEIGWQFLLALSLLMTAAAGEFTLRQFWAARSQPTFRTLAVERLEQDPVDVIFVGSSHIHTGINPTRFPQSVINLSDNALDYRTSEILCHKYWSQVSQAKLVVIELDATPVHADTILHLKGSYKRLFQWGLSAGELPLSSLESLKAIILEHLEVARHNNWRAFIKPLRPGYKRFGPGYTVLGGQLNASEWEQFYTKLGTDCEPFVAERNLSCLRRLLFDLRSADVKVKLLRPPFHYDYWKHPTTKIRNQYAEMALKVFLEIPGASESDVIDLRHEWQFADNCFYDWTHLSEYGAHRLSDYLAERIDLNEE